MNIKFNKTVQWGVFALVTGVLPLQALQAGLAVSPGVTTHMLDEIDTIQDGLLREMLRTAVWPGFGEYYMDLERDDEILTPFEKKYKEQPLDWDQKVENVRYILDSAENLQTLKPQELEYVDIAFGEAVIPVPDKRVVAIAHTEYLTTEIERLQQQQQKALAAFYEAGEEGAQLQEIEDEYAAKLAALMQTEREFKKAKIEFLRLSNQQKFGRIDDKTFKAKTRTVVEDFENFVVLASENPVFTDEELKAVASRIYAEDEETVNSPVELNYEPLVPANKWRYGVASVVIMLLATFFGFLAFRRYKK